MKLIKDESSDNYSTGSGSPSPHTPDPEHYCTLGRYLPSPPISPVRGRSTKVTFRSSDGCSHPQTSSHSDVPQIKFKAINTGYKNNSCALRGLESCSEASEHSNPFFRGKLLKEGKPSRGGRRSKYKGNGKSFLKPLPKRSKSVIKKRSKVPKSGSSSCMKIKHGIESDDSASPSDRHLCGDSTSLLGPDDVSTLSLERHSKLDTSQVTINQFHGLGYKSSSKSKTAMMTLTERSRKEVGLKSSGHRTSTNDSVTSSKSPRKSPPSGKSKPGTIGRSPINSLSTTIAPTIRKRTARHRTLSPKRKSGKIVHGKIALCRGYIPSSSVVVPHVPGERYPKARPYGNLIVYLIIVGNVRAKIAVETVEPRSIDIASHST